MKIGKWAIRPIAVALIGTSTSQCGSIENPPPPDPPAQMQSQDAVVSNGSDNSLRMENAGLEGLPSAVSDVDHMQVKVHGLDLDQYRYKYVNSDVTSTCQSSEYSEWKSILEPIVVFDLGADGPKLLCVIGRRTDGLEQKSPTEYRWVKQAKTAPRTVVSLEVSPNTVSLPSGTNSTFKVEATYSDGVKADVTHQVALAVLPSEILTVTGGPGDPLTIHGLKPGIANVTATLEKVTAQMAATITAATLTSLSVEPATLTIIAGTSGVLKAKGVFSDQSQQDMTGSVTWSSANAAIAGVGDGAATKGTVQGIAVGSAVISASFQALKASSVVSVSPAVISSISVTPANSSLVVGTNKQFKAIALMSNGTTQDVTASANWSSSLLNTATLAKSSDSIGLVQAANEGTATITAAAGGKIGSTKLTVVPATVTSISIKPAQATMIATTTLQFTAIGAFNNGTSQDITSAVTWSASGNGIASVSNVAATKGRVTAIAAGSASISGSLNGVIGSTTVTVTPIALSSVAVSPANLTLPIGSSVQYMATGLYNNGTSKDLTADVVWTCSAPSVATISSSGSVTAVMEGSAKILATSGNLTGSALLVISAAPSQ